MEFALTAISFIVVVIEPFSTIVVYAALTTDMDSEHALRRHYHKRPGEELEIVAKVHEEY
jgi:hypothetical protein